MKWYPVKTIKGQELRATQELNNQYPDRCFCPTRFTLRGKEVALWDTYTIIQLELGQDDISPIRSTRGVNQGLLRFGDNYPSIPDKIAEAAIQRPIEYEQAKQIRVLSGPFEHLICDLISADEKKVMAWVTILGKPQKVPFSHDNIITL